GRYVYAWTSRVDSALYTGTGSRATSTKIAPSSKALAVVFDGAEFHVLFGNYDQAQQVLSANYDQRITSSGALDGTPVQLSTGVNAGACVGGQCVAVGG